MMRVLIPDAPHLALVIHEVATAQSRSEHQHDGGHPDEKDEDLAAVAQGGAEG